MTDLEKHVSQPGRDKLVKQVRAKINELGVEYIFFQFISVTGRVVGKGIPTDHWERTCEKGFQFFEVQLFDHCYFYRCLFFYQE